MPTYPQPTQPKKAAAKAVAKKAAARKAAAVKPRPTTTSPRPTLPTLPVPTPTPQAPRGKERGWPAGVDPSRLQAGDASDLVAETPRGRGWDQQIADRRAGLVPGFIGAGETLEDFAARTAEDFAARTAAGA